MKELRIVFMGTPQFAIPSLEQIYHSHYKIAAIVTQPDRPKGRGKKLSPPPVKEFATQNNITPVFQPISLKEPEFIEALRKLNADVFVVVAFRILPEEVFLMPPKERLICTLPCCQNIEGQRQSIGRLLMGRRSPA